LLKHCDKEAVAQIHFGRIRHRYAYAYGRIHIQSHINKQKQTSGIHKQESIETEMPIYVHGPLCNPSLGNGKRSRDLVYGFAPTLARECECIAGGETSMRSTL
jgi:hypothetical protein